MASRVLFQFWGLLVVLSAATTGLTMVHAQGHLKQLITAAVLALAGVKARIILARYLGLAASRFWTRVFDVVLGVFLALALVIYLVGEKG